MKNSKPVFVVDAMLGKLAKKLRLLGYDSLYSSDIDDDELLGLAKNENRILITKDLHLVQKAAKEKIDSIQITKDDEVEQFLQINDKIRLGQAKINANISRCPICNGQLAHTNKNNVLGKIHQGVFDSTDEFWMCKNCKKIYWEGTHIKNLQKFTSRLNDRL